ncbi:MAG: valine--tRNA ligase [bacterium]|nr:valine--tRNA ligase [bacterium]
MDIPAQYQPKEIEARVYAAWEASGSFTADPEAPGAPFCIVIPPPNVTGALHLGHAINNTLQDILIRYHRMCGDATLWLPGVDHAGIATQAIVEKTLFEQEGVTRHDIGREALVQRIWQWKEKYGNRIIEQLKLMGCSCDWTRTRFTLDQQCARAVRHTFFRMFCDGLIYRGMRLVNWDTHLQTAVSDDEIYHETVRGHLWYYWYPVKGSSTRLLIATTRPETMLGDTAVAVHPDDPRYQHLIGKTVILPLVGREIPIIADGELVDMTFGTGCVKVTPAHDPNDYACALRHGLPMINILNPDGTINANGGRFAGMERYAARKAVVAALEAEGLLEKVEPYETQIGHSDRSKTPIEPFLSEQWFIKMAGLAEAAMEAVTSGRVTFHPPRYAKMYLDWLAEKRDWPISRQLWWGHRIPIWYAPGCDEAVLQEAFGNRKDIAWQWDEAGERWLICALEDDLAGDAVPGVTLSQDPDVLDTWFSSALWPHATLGWPERTADFVRWYPTSVLVTSRDIITLWVARMVMTGLYNTGTVPFPDVTVHVKILDGQGQTMSKSKGNGVDPVDIIEQYGADALRYCMAHMATETQDVRMPVQYKCPHCGALTPQTPKNMTVKTLVCPHCSKTMATRWADDATQAVYGLALLTSDKFEIGRNFANKLWNASRLALLNLAPGIPLLTPKELLADRSLVAAITNTEAWILERLADTTISVTNALHDYHFHEVAVTLYSFIWSEFCDWYLEAIKPVLYGDDAAARRHAQVVLACVLNTTLRLAHPVLPFITEEIWTLLHEVTQTPCHTMLIKAAWPEAQRGFCDAERVRRVLDMFETIRLGRHLRSEYNIAPGVRVRFALKPHDEPMAAMLRAEEPLLRKFLGASEVCIDPAFVPPRPLPSHAGAGASIYLYLDGALDVRAERARIAKQLAELDKYLAGVRAKLNNEKFVRHAAPEVVEQERAKCAEAEAKRVRLAHMQALLQAAE